MDYIVDIPQVDLRGSNNRMLRYLVPHLELVDVVQGLGAVVLDVL